MTLTVASLIVGALTVIVLAYVAGEIRRNTEVNMQILRILKARNGDTDIWDAIDDAYGGSERNG